MKYNPLHLAAPALILALAPVPGRTENYAPGNVGTFVASGSGGSGLVPLTGCFSGVITTDASGNAQCTPLSQFVMQTPSGVGVTTPPATVVPAAPTGLTTSATPNTITVGWSPVTAVTSYIIYKDGSSTPLATLPANTTSYTDTMIESGTDHSYAVFAVNAIGVSPYAGSIFGNTTVAASYGAQYPGLLGSNGGAATATAVQANAGAFLASYADGQGGLENQIASALGTQDQFNQFMGKPLSTVPVSIHSGQANVSDFVNSVPWVLGVGGYSGPKVLSIPLVYNDGTPGGELASAANPSGPYRALWTQIANTILAEASNRGQPVEYIRTAWEFNQNNGASAPWYSGGQTANFIGAFRNFVSTFKAAEAAFTPAAGKAKPHMLYVWCWNNQGDDPSASYPGDTYVDVIAQDKYVFLQYGDNPDPDTAFNQFLTTGYGLQYMANFAAAHGNKPKALPEFGANVDGWGQYEKLLYNYVTAAANNFAYVTLWNSNGDYKGQCNTGQTPQTCAMLRHLWNPAMFSVEPIPAPIGVITNVGNGTITIATTPLPASANVTTYNLYAGSASGQEALATPIATSPTPAFTLASINGIPKFFKISGSNALSNGFLSAEVTATATPPANNTPAHYVALGSTGYASTPITPAMIPGAQDWSIQYTHCITNLGDANKPNGVSSTLAGVWASSGYLESLVMALNGGTLIEGVHDNSGNSAGYYGAITVAQNACYVDEVDYSAANGTGSVYHDALGAGTRTLVGGIGSFGAKTTRSGVPSTDPTTHIAPSFRIGQDSDGTEQYSGLFASLIYKIGTTVILNPVVNADGTIHDVTGATWSTGGGAVFH